MPRRHILTKRRRHTLLALPTDEPSLLEHYTLAEDDLEHIRHRRRPPRSVSAPLRSAPVCTSALASDPPSSMRFSLFRWYKNPRLGQAGDSWVVPTSRVAEPWGYLTLL